MEKNTEILVILKNLDSKSYLNKLIEITLNIALTYLHFNYKKIYKFLRDEKLKTDELAIDAIAPLFTRDKRDQIITIQSAFNSWKPEIKTEEDAVFFLNKIVASRIEQHIYYLLKEEDPFFSKILDSMNYLVKSQGYQKTQSYGKTYIVKSGYEIAETKFISSIDFENLPMHLFSDKKSLILKLIEYIEKELNCVAAIPLNDLVYKLKHIYFSGYTIIESTEITHKQFEMDEIIKLALNSALEKLDKSYYSKGKLNQCESSAIRSALVDICEDLKNGGISPGLYNYLTPHMKNLSKENYDANYHNILEYLLKYTKRVIAEHLVEKN